MILGGIDEAGRGSIIGPLVVAGISFDSKEIDRLKDMKITDSKKLQPIKRQTLFKEIILLCKSVYICKINCITIDKFVALNQLNKLESKFMTIIANNLDANKIIVDACDVNTYRFQQEIKKGVKNKSISIYSFHKADLDNIIVSCASIVAKVTRDNEITKIKEKIGKDIGSGYPSDPKTKAFIKDGMELNSLNLKNYIRFSWKPIKQILVQNAQTKLF